MRKPFAFALVAAIVLAVAVWIYPNLFVSRQTADISAVGANHSNSPLVSGASLASRHLQGPNRLLIKFRLGTSAEEQKSILNQHRPKKIGLYGEYNQKREANGVTVRGPELFDRLAWFELPDQASDTARNAIKEALQHNPKVEYAEDDQEVQIVATIPNDYDFSKLWGLNNTGQTGGTPDADIDAPEAWDLNTGSPQVVVAVIDTGVDYTHQDLAQNMWANEDEIPSNRIDDDHNGYIDDFYGYDFFNRDGDPMDDHFHGTHVSGTIGAVGNDGVGVAGVNWRVKIMALKFLNSSGSGMNSDAISAIQYATLNGAQVMNNSWGGGGYDQSLQDAITAANNAGVLFVAAAGNNNGDTANFSPAGMAGVLTVAATDHKDLKASFSNWGAQVEVAAPGVGIFSTTPRNAYATYNGTSMATPQVAGLAALIKSRNFSLTKDQIQQIIQSSTDDLGALGRDDYFGYGRINAFKALSLVSPVANDFPVTRITSPAPGTFLSTPIDIVGSATGATFSSWRLDYAPPEAGNWIAVNSSSAPIENGVLGRITPQSSWPDGQIAVRLSVQTILGGVITTYANYRYVTAQLISPAPYGEFKSGTDLPIKGTAAGAGFISYKLEYGPGEAPSSWNLIGQSSTPVGNNILETFSVPASLDGYYAVRLTVQFQDTVKQIVRPIYIDGQELSGWPRSFNDTNEWFWTFDTPLTLASFNQETRLFASYGFVNKGAVGIVCPGPKTMIDQFRADASAVSGWPPSSFGFNVSAPAVGDLDNDGANEIILTEETCANSIWQYRLLVLGPDGSLKFSRPIGATANNNGQFNQRLTPTLVDLDKDGFLDIVVGGDQTGSIRAFDRLGNSLPGFPIVIPNANSIAQTWPSAVAVADLDGDSKKELAFWVSTTDNIYHLFIYRSDGTPFPMTQAIQSYPQAENGVSKVVPPVIGDINGDGVKDIVAGYWGSSGGALGAFKPSGVPLSGWPKSGFGQVMGLALGDLNDDHVPEVIARWGAGYQVLKGDGTFMPTKDIVWGTILRNDDPLVADVDADSKPDIVIKATRQIQNLFLTSIYAFHAAGSLVAGYPKQLSKPSITSDLYHYGSPVIGDINQDGKLDLLASASALDYSWTLDGITQNSQIKAWSLPTLTANAKIEWGKARGDLYNTGEYQSSASLPPPPLPPIDTTAPTTNITSPAGGASVSGVITVSAGATDNIGVTKVEFYKDGNVGPFASDTSSPYSVSLDTATLSNGSHTLTSKASDAAGNVGVSEPVIVTVSNSAPSLLTATIFCNGSDTGCSIPYNTSATISWSSTGANSCAILPTNWLGISGSQSTGPLTINGVYTLTCYNPAGANISDAITVTIGDVTPPPPAGLTIGSPTASTIGPNSATITWTTNIASTGSVNYGLSTNSLTQSKSDSSSSTSHSVTLTGLQKSTKYYYQITATANGQTVTSSTGDFRTKNR